MGRPMSLNLGLNLFWQSKLKIAIGCLPALHASPALPAGRPRADRRLVPWPEKLRH